MSKKRHHSGPISFSEDLGRRPDMQWLDVDLLVVDRNYQREIKSRRVHKLCTKFNWRDYQPITVTEVDGGKFAVIDGQHRAAAARLHPKIDALPVYVVDAPEVASQASAFITVNRDRVPVNSVELYWSGIVAEDPDYLEMERVLKEAGVKAADYQAPNTPPLTMSSLGVLKSTTKRNGSEAVTMALKATAQAHPNTREAFGGTFVASLSRLIREADGKIEFDVLVSALRGAEPKQLWLDAMAYRKVAGGSTENALMLVITKLYNKRLPGRDGRRLEAAA